MYVASPPQLSVATQRGTNDNTVTRRVYQLWEGSNKKALKLYMEAGSAGDSNVVDPQIQEANGVHVLPPKEETELRHVDGFDEKDNSFAVSPVLTRADRIRQRLETELEPMVLDIDDISHQHAGHAAVPDQARETHFNVKIVSSKFEGRSLVKRHRLIYELLQ